MGENVKQLLNYWLRISPVWRWIPHHRQARLKDIILFSSQRSGSTWIMELIGNEPGMRIISEPLLPHFPIISKYLQPQTRFLPGEELQVEELKRYFEDIINGRVYARTHKDGLAKNPWPTNRSVFKILRGNAMIPWFHDTFDFQTIFLLRHPIPTALSRMKNKWGTHLNEYLENTAFTNEFLDEKSIQAIKDSQQKPLLTYVAAWTLDNLPAIRFHQKNPEKLPVFFYEDIVLRPEQNYNRLKKLLGLKQPYNPSLSKATSKNTKYSTKETEHAITKHDTEKILGRWKQLITPDQEKEVFELLDLLQIPWYSEGKILPQKNK